MIQCLLVAAGSFSVEKITRLGSILRFRSTVNEASFGLGVAVVLVGGIIRGEPMRMSPHSTALGAGFGEVKIRISYLVFRIPVQAGDKLREAYWGAFN